ncbi:MAG: hypothetical protein VR69_03295 [Peptococcaceae bacterium BRH_c4b]|nr:MAG: hypothetical protein VR69_03295 [Peptococcaceae bacterium BRH_c4b]
MFEMTFWRAIFFIGLIMILILKYRNGLDIMKTLPAAIIAIVLSFLGNIALVELNFISYNPAKLGSQVLGVSLFHQLSTGLIAMLLIHFLPEERKDMPIYLASFALIVDFIVYVAVQLNVIKFVQWGYITNFIFDFLALGIVYYSYEFVRKKYLT